MKRMKRVLSVLLAVVLLSTLCIGVVSAKDQEANNGTMKKVSILFTHDLHSHLDVTTSDEGIEVGGFGKLRTFIKQAKTKNPATVVVDSGDFSMGTLYQTIYETHAAELSMLGMLGYDAVTMGNHEFDYRGEGFANMLESAIKNADTDSTIQLPALVSANIDWAKNNSEDNQKVKQAMEDYGSSAYTIVEREGVKIGIFGVMGKDSEACAPESGISFEDIIETSKEVVSELKRQKVDVIICLSHSGTWEDPEKSEDEQLAKAVPEIDVIVSGHTHTILAKPIIYNNTYIVSSGSYGANIGEIELIPSENGRWEIADYEMHPMDNTIKTDNVITEQLKQYKQVVNKEYLSQFGYTYDQVLASNQIKFQTIDDILLTRGEDTLGDLISDAYIYAIKQAEGTEYEAVDMAVVPSGIIRASLNTGNITVGEAFEVSSLGIGPDRVPSYPLVSVYLTGKELKSVAEVDASISPLMDGTELFPSGIGWEYNPNRLVLNRVTKVWKTTSNGKKEVIKDDSLYRVVADLYSAQMLGAVNGKSYGLLSLIPKDKDGNAVTNFEKQIVYNGNTKSEVKEWVALANYLESFDKTNGVPVVPTKYEKTQGRKVVNDSTNIGALLKNPNKVFFIIVGVLLLLMLLIIFVIWLIRYLIKRSKRKKNMIY
ncbi:MAG: bifunctional UDP-sugar hydrolase/5'-nucleotidase [Lachnospiraceae bacterium]|nr:bifunctional UDP-sugar hydrolase/5'-nucleotidase [Lachnospiraceae bacterium]